MQSELAISKLKQTSDYSENTILVHALIYKMQWNWYGVVGDPQKCPEIDIKREYPTLMKQFPPFILASLDKDWKYIPSLSPFSKVDESVHGIYSLSTRKVSMLCYISNIGLVLFVQHKSIATMDFQHVYALLCILHEW